MIFRDIVIFFRSDRAVFFLLGAATALIAAAAVYWVSHFIREARKNPFSREAEMYRLRLNQRPPSDSRSIDGDRFAFESGGAIAIQSGDEMLPLSERFIWPRS